MNSITQTNDNQGKIFASIENFFQRFGLNQKVRKVNAVKSEGFSFQQMFCYLIRTIFSGMSSHRFYKKYAEDLPFSEKTVYNTLNDGRINWQLLLLQLAGAVIGFLDPLTDENRKNVYIIDDSIFERINAKCVELSANLYDHAKKRYTKGFRFLQLGWSDGNTFIPVNFSLLSGNNRIKDAKGLDKRTNSGKRKEQSLRKATDIALELLKSALAQGIKANYVLFDTWFSGPTMFHALRSIGLHTVAMVKKSSKVHYRYKEKMTDVKTIFKQERKRPGRSRYLLSVVVEAIVNDQEIPVKLVFVRNRNKRKEYLVLASTDTSLTEDEIIQLYSKRWKIEIYFKMCKQYLRLSKFQGISYDGIFAHTTVVAVAYMILALQEREQTDSRSFGELFFLTVDELADIPFVEAIHQLLNLFEEAFQDEYVLSQKELDNIIEEFIGKLPPSIQTQLKQGVCG